MDKCRLGELVRWHRKDDHVREIGGYIELDNYNNPMLHEGALALNCGRNCLAYLIRARKIKKILLPYFLCDSVRNLCEKEQVQVEYYNNDEQFLPIATSFDDETWLYVVNYYGQLTSEQIKAIADKYDRVIIDNAQAYFDMPVQGVDTLYTCRKYFGVPDGAFLYTDASLNDELPLDESFGRMNFLLGRYERTASEFYGEYAANNHLFANEPLKRMSKLTYNLLHGIDYEDVKQKRTENYMYLKNALDNINLIKPGNIEGAFAYPLLIENGAEVRKKLIEKKIYVPTLWPNVLNDTPPESIEHRFADNILPLPVDQRYEEEDMEYMVQEVLKCIN